MHSHQLLLLSRDHARYRELLTAAGLPGLAIAWSDKETGLPRRQPLQRSSSASRRCWPVICRNYRNWPGHNPPLPGSMP